MSVLRSIGVDFGAATDIGLIRANNEDRFTVAPQLGLFLVVDGVGGQAAGEVASECVATAIQRFIQDTADDGSKTWPFGVDPAMSDDGNRLRVAALIANQALNERIIRNDSLKGMAATVCALLLRDAQAVVASVGDCRTYLFRTGALTQVTVDHSWVAEQVRLGLLDAEGARQHPMRNIVTRALDGRDHLAVDIVEFTVQPHDTLLLCSDGLSSMVADDAIRRCLADALPDADEACRRLVESAKRGGGRDNVTVLVVNVLERSTHD